MRALLFSLALLVLIAAPKTVRAQEDPNERVIRNKKVSEWLTIVLTSKDERQQQVALITLDQAGPQVRGIFTAISAVVRDKAASELVRKTAVQVLGRLGAKARDRERAEKIPVETAVDALSYALKKDSAVSVRVLAASALGRIGADIKEDGLLPLKVGLKDSDAEVRAASADAIGQLGPLSHEAVDELIDALRASKGEANLKVRLAVVQTLQQIGKPDAKPATAALLDILNEPLPTDKTIDTRPIHEIRRVAIETLGDLGSIEALEPLGRILEKALKDKDTKTGLAAAAAINHFGQEKKAVLPVLIETLKIEHDGYIRCHAIHAIGQLGRELGKERVKVIQALREALTDKHLEVRLASIQALGEFGPMVLGDQLKDVQTALEQAAKAPEKPLREAAAAALKQIKQ